MWLWLPGDPGWITNNFDEESLDRHRTDPLVQTWKPILGTTKSYATRRLSNLSVCRYDDGSYAVALLKKAEKRNEQSQHADPEKLPPVHGLKYIRKHPEFLFCRTGVATSAVLVDCLIYYACTPVNAVSLPVPIPLACWYYNTKKNSIATLKHHFEGS